MTNQKINSKGIFLDKYFDTLFRQIQLVKEITEDEKEALKLSIISKKKNHEISIHNNYKDKLMDTDMEKILDIYYGDKKPIISGYGVLFKHNENIPGKILEYLLSQRKVVKHEMFLHMNDADKSIYNNKDVEQKSIKVLANAFYGAFGQGSFHFYNKYLGPSTTYSGQLIIMSAVLGFESAMAGNFDIQNFDELVSYIDNIQKEPINEEISIYEHIDREDLLAEVFEWLTSKCSFEMSDTNEEVFAEILYNLSFYELEKLLFKNNFAKFISQPDISELFDLCVIPEFVNSEKPPKEIEDEINMLREYADYFLLYPYQWNNKHIRVENMKRKCIVISDTDSCFLNLNPVVEWYSEYKQEVLDKKTQFNCCMIATHLMSHLVNKIFYELTTHMNVDEKSRSKISMKNEFYMPRLLLTRNKKQYASSVYSQEGVIFDEVKFDIKGLSIKKIATPKIARKVFSKILEDDIINSETIKPIEVFLKFVEFERRIKTSLLSGESSFLKPTKFSSFDRYAKPLQMQAVRGVFLWNALFPNKYIPNFSNVNIVKLKRMTKEEAVTFFSDNDYSEGINKFFSTEGIEKYGVDIIAIPKDVSGVPDILKKLIDIGFVVDSNMKNGNILLESIGFKIVKSLKQDTFTNLISM